MSQDRYYEAVYDPDTGAMTLTPRWKPNAPAYARQQGYGGSLVTGQSFHARETMEKHAQKERERKARLRG